MSKYEGKQLLPVQYLWTKDLVESEVKKVKEEVTIDLREFMKGFVKSQGITPSKAIDEMTIEALREEMRIILDTQNSCEIGVDQSGSINLMVLEKQFKEEINEIKGQMKDVLEQVAKIEIESLPEDIKSKFKKVFSQIAEIRAEGIRLGSAQYIKGISYDTGEPFDPSKQSDAICKFGYGGDHGAVMDEMKEELYRRGLAERPPIVQIEDSPAPPTFDTAKCSEALMVKGKIEQCPHFRFGKSKYCKEHAKMYEEKE